MSRNHPTLHGNLVEEKARLTMQIFSFVMQQITTMLNPAACMQSNFQSFLMEFDLVELKIDFQLSEWCICITYLIKGVNVVYESYANNLPRSYRLFNTVVPTILNDCTVISDSLYHYRFLFQDLINCLEYDESLVNSNTIEKEDE